ncbi:hypothetical protein [Gordonia caeni]|uniref:Restriction endonuclease n=1 Tax=Gordonia caeni TaxID=1007097 RepID=A0ABP7PIH7_9ACTN
MSDPIPIPVPERLTGREALTTNGQPAGWSLSDFWAWSSSDLLGNALRGMLAEFIVGTALDCIGTDAVRQEWDATDLITKDGLAVEVKSTAYLQSWGPTTTGSLRFGIGETYGWDARSNTYSPEHKRQADAYIFCVFTAKDRSTADPLDTDQWEFYAVSTACLNRTLGRQKSVALSVIKKLDGVTPGAYSDLADIVSRVLAGTDHHNRLK